jgi:hypothetical protein
MTAFGHEPPVETYLWRVRSAPKNARRYGSVMNVRYKWLRAPDLNLRSKRERVRYAQGPNSSPLGGSAY